MTFAWPNSLRGKNLWIGLGLLALVVTVGVVVYFMNKKKPGASDAPVTTAPPATTGPAKAEEIVVVTPMTTKPPVFTTKPPAPFTTKPSTPFTTRPAAVKKLCTGWFGDGPIWSNAEAQGGKCASVCRRLRPGSVFTGEWKTTVPGSKSVCQCRYKC